jgi:ADP-heptose:LPS heptosyltransferase
LEGWHVEDWREFVRLFRRRISEDFQFVVVGADWDSKCKIDHVLDLTGQTSLATLVTMIKRSRYFVAFASGLPILSTVVGTPVCMLYPKNLEGLMYSWPPPEMVMDDSYIGMLWDSPEKVVSRIERHFV